MRLDASLNSSPARFPELGYVVVPDVLGLDEAAELGQLFDSLPMVSDHSDIIGWRSEAAERALVGDERFLEVATDPGLVACVREILGDDLQLIDYVAMEIGAASGRERAWHVDLPFFTHPVCLSVIAAVYLDDMTQEMGPLHVIAGSHAWQRVPTAAEAEAMHADEVPVGVPAGTAVVFDSQIWHTGTRNTSDRPRRALFLHYAHYWMKRLDEFHRGPLPEPVAESTDPLVRQLFGIELSALSIWGSQYTREQERIRV